MFGKSSFHPALAAMVGLVALVFAAAGASAQQVRTSMDGETQVSFWNGCVVYYDNDGRRTDHQSCGQDQLQRADAIVAQRQQAYGGGGFGSPRVDFNQNGYARVLFPDGCAVTYDNSGRRISHQSCGQEQVAAADRAVATGSAGQWFGGVTRWDNYSSGPRVFVASNGAGRVVVGGGCTAYYDSSGRRTSHESCGQNQLQRADQAMYSWRLNRGFGGSAWYFD